MPTMSSLPIGSVAIPAHNEAKVIRRCLDALLTGLAPGELEVAVSCNGCADETADIVRSSWPEVRVIELAQASKPAALRAADEVLAAFPRIYLDADVILPASSAKRLIRVLQTGSLEAARPTFRYDTSRCDRLVRSYYNARLAVIARRHMLQGGAYGLSRAGRSRFGTYPDVIADDLYADQWFLPSEIEVVDDAPAMVSVPDGIRDLFRVLRRRKQGDIQLRSLHKRASNTLPSTLRSLISMAVSGPSPAVDALVFGAIAAAVRASIVVYPPKGWARDESSRTNIMAADEYNIDLHDKGLHGFLNS